MIFRSTSKISFCHLIWYTFSYFQITSIGLFLNSEIFFFTCNLVDNWLTVVDHKSFLMTDINRTIPFNIMKIEMYVVWDWKNIILTNFLHLYLSWQLNAPFLHRRTNIEVLQHYHSILFIKCFLKCSYFNYCDLIILIVIRNHFDKIPSIFVTDK